MSEAPNLHDSGSLDETAGRLLADMYARRGRALYGLCRMMLRDPHEAEDALQSTFLSAHRSLLGGTVPRDEAAWLATIARNECRGRIGDRMRRPVTLETVELEAVADTARTPEELLVDHGVGKALAALPERQRDAVVLHDVFGLRAREVGVALGLSVPAVEAALFRARRQLRLRVRPVGASALSLPLGVQETLSLQIPGFAAGGVGAGTMAVGAGVLAKAVGTPTVLKVFAGAAALATAGSVAVVGTYRHPTFSPRPSEVSLPTGDNASRVADDGVKPMLEPAGAGSAAAASGGGGGSAAGRSRPSGATTRGSVSPDAGGLPAPRSRTDDTDTGTDADTGKDTGDDGTADGPGATSTTDGAGSDAGSSSPNGEATDDGGEGSSSSGSTSSATTDDPGETTGDPSGEDTAAKQIQTEIGDDGDRSTSRESETELESASGGSSESDTSESSDESTPSSSDSETEPGGGDSLSADSGSSSGSSGSLDD